MGHRQKKLEMTALNVNSIAQNINIYCHGTISTVHLSKQYPQLRVPSLTEEVAASQCILNENNPA